ncbi:hypothetical protein BN946_scf184939.g22 [Trametes cinnabarina]|uniref:L domain-like protein n=1 Tax=Pycnoporus cinnabarinus TaxID=5643 RepID=A0A060SHC8_PYCCI|nr:hypothetical protein BN946_scf184939.g22 [Trametes cinnabarina]
MSRLPQPTSRSGSRSPLKSPSSPSPTPRAAAASTLTPGKPRIRTQSVAPTPSPRQTTTLRSQPSLKNIRPTPARSPTKSPARRTQPLPSEDEVPPTPSRPQLSIREQIALKRAEAKKLATKTPSPNASEGFTGLENASPDTFNQPQPVDIDLGRCTHSSLDTRKKGSQNAPSWYEAQDLEVLKAWSNEIMELQPEISMFGSLKTVDLHNNKLTALPDSFRDLTALTSVDLSHNQLTSLPANFWALPNLTTLNLSHNALTALPFSSPFAASGSNPLGRTRDPRGDWFAETITRATEPLPRLTVLEVSHNRITAASIDHATDGPGLPLLLAKLDLSDNPLGKSDSLFRALARLQRLKEIHMQRADIGDESFPVSIFSSSDGTFFHALKVLDLEETYVTRPAIEATFTPNVLKQTIQFDVTAQEPPEGVLRVIVGKRVVKEPWEIEAERRTKLRRNAAAAGPFATASTSSSTATPAAIGKDPWEIEAEQGLLSEGAKRRARALAAASRSSASESVGNGAVSTPHSSQKPPVVKKEPWELEAEAGLLSAGVRRRARAAAALSGNLNSEPNGPSGPSAGPKTPSPTNSPSPSLTPPTIASALSNPQVYSASAQTLTLPPSIPPSKAAHARSFSLASPALGKALGGPARSELALAIPTPTLPLAAIASQPFAQTLKVLNLKGRRSDPSFSIPSAQDVFLPLLEELSFENCNLGDSIPVSRVGDDVTQRTSEPLLPLLARLFPSLRTLDLSYNALTSAALTKDALSALILADSVGTDEGGVAVKKGLRHLRLRGNRLNELDGFQQFAERFRGNRDLPDWKLEELDLRDNEIGKLPPELGMLPLDVFLVDGNT